MSWVKDFEEKFMIPNHNKDCPYLIIEGEQPYLQKINNNNIAVVIDDHIKKFFKKAKCEFYNNFDVVAFLVNDWIKIQDSLEMIFNLLTGNRYKSLQMLSYLRTKQIPAYQFACYLYSKHKIILINRYSFSNGKRTSQLELIKTLIKKLSNVHILIVGDRACKSLSKIATIGRVVHSSGLVLNKMPEDYYNTWYLLNDNCVRDRADNFSLGSFNRL